MNKILPTILLMTLGCQPTPTPTPTPCRHSAFIVTEEKQICEHENHYLRTRQLPNHKWLAECICIDNLKINKTLDTEGAFQSNVL